MMANVSEMHRELASWFHFYGCNSELASVYTQMLSVEVQHALDSEDVRVVERALEKVEQHDRLKRVLHPIGAGANG